MSLTNVKFMLKYKVTNSDEAKRKSMTGGGPLKVDPEHWFYKALPAPHIFDDDNPACIPLAQANLPFGYRLFKRDQGWH